MQKGRLSYYSAVALGLVGMFFLLSLILSFYGIRNTPGNFLKDSFTYASFFIPFYIFIAAILSFKEKFSRKWILLLTLTILPFLTSVLFLKVYLDIDSSLLVIFMVNLIGRKEGSFLLFLLFVVEILMIYVLSIKISANKLNHTKTDIPIEDRFFDSLKDQVSDEDHEIVENTYSDKSILRPGVSSELLGTNFLLDSEDSKVSTSNETIVNPFSKEHIPGLTNDMDVDLPELPSLEKLKSLEKFNSSESIENSRDISIEYGDNDVDSLEEYSELEELDEPEEEEVFSEIGTDHLINADSPDNILDTNTQTNDSLDKDIETAKFQKKFTYANYSVPIKNILKDYANSHYWVIDDTTRLAAEVLRETLEEFKIKAEVTGIKKGPVITMFEILPAPGVKLSKIANLADNIAMRLAASRVRIVAPIPGKHAVGIEIPNKERAIVSFKEMLQDDKFKDPKNEIPIAIGKDITGNTQIIDLVKTPHLLIAGATGSGKSVCVNALICSILYKRNPDQVRLLLIDPKIVELKLYNGIPHLLTPVITEPKRAFQALQYCIYIMEQRYALLDGMGVRDIRSYNKKIVRNRIATKKLPYIVVIVDEFADLIATSGKELESILARLAAMARAVGIHLVLATQRPSIDVITGLIKANIPSRIAFMVSNKIDSRIILDTAGADKLLGQGDMLFSSAWDPSLTRVQGAFLSDVEVESVTAHVKTLGEPDYIDEEIFYDDNDDESPDTGSYSTNDPLMDKAIETVVAAGKAS
ncbi:MAG: DNA translocase FtsK, partial [Spirochaetia bacterium]|nr:DNA translocase FtsK [Spirochaetia bacterium]